MILKLDVKCCPNKYDKYNDVIYGVFPYVTQPENDTSLNYIFKRTRWAFPSNRFTWPLLEQWNEWQTNSVISTYVKDDFKKHIFKEEAPIYASLLLNN